MLLPIRRWSLLATSFAMLLGLCATDVGAQSVGFKLAVAAARDAESKGDYVQANTLYMELLRSSNPAFGPIPLEVKRDIGRRAASCATAYARKQTGGREVDAIALQRWIDTSKEMMKLEPDNAVWPYEIGSAYSFEGKYADASKYLQLCTNSKGGDPAVKQRASQLYAKLQSEYHVAKQEQARLNAISDAASSPHAVMCGNAAMHLGRANDYKNKYGVTDPRFKAEYNTYLRIKRQLGQ